MRRINFVPQTEFPYRPYGSRSVIYDSGNYQSCLDKAVAAFDYTQRREEQRRLRSAGHYRGIGVAAYTYMCGMAPSRRLATIGFDRTWPFAIVDEVYQMRSKSSSYTTCS